MTLAMDTQECGFLPQFPQGDVELFRLLYRAPMVVFIRRDEDRRGDILDVQYPEFVVFLPGQDGGTGNDRGRSRRSRVRWLIGVSKAKTMCTR